MVDWVHFFVFSALGLIWVGHFCDLGLSEEKLKHFGIVDKCLIYIPLKNNIFFLLFKNVGIKLLI